MGAEKAESKAQEAAAEAATSQPADLSSPTADQQHEQDPPQYFDSEPSSQPPSYNKQSGNASSSKRNSGPASAASVNAILGPPPEKHKKMSLKERWKELLHNGHGQHLGADRPDFGPTHSRTTLNIGQADFVERKKKNG